MINYIKYVYKHSVFYLAMDIISKGKIIKIPLKLKPAHSHKEMGLGLMFKRKKNFDYGLVFYFRQSSRFLNSIHMFFVFFPIFAVFLNEKKEVVDTKILKPFYPFYAPKRKCKYLIEMPAKYKKEIKLKDKIKF